MTSLAKRRLDLAASMTAERLVAALKLPRPGGSLLAFELLQSGASNLNFLLRFKGAKDPLVLRIYIREPAAWSKEVGILRALSGVPGIPEILDADPLGQDGPWILYRFLDGIPFQQVKRQESNRDQGAAAHAVGVALAGIQTAALACTSWTGHVTRPGSLAVNLDAPLLKARLGGRRLARLHDFLADWWPRISPLTQASGLVHGDFNNRNLLLQRTVDSWKVSGILDWEQAFLGSPLWDAARFICYERPDQPCREPHFSHGFSQAGGILPPDWTDFARALNTVSAALSLSRETTQPQFIPELQELVAAAVDRSPSRTVG